MFVEWFFCFTKVQVCLLLATECFVLGEYEGFEIDQYRDIGSWPGLLRVLAKVQFG